MGAKYFSLRNSTVCWGGDHSWIFATGSRPNRKGATVHVKKETSHEGQEGKMMRDQEGSSMGETIELMKPGHRIASQMVFNKEEQALRS